MYDESIDQVSLEFHIAGAAMSLNSNVLPIFKQLGMLDELMDISLPINSLDMYKESLKPIGAYDVTSYKAM